MSHTFVVLNVTQETYNEIKEKLLKAGYDQALCESDGEETIDMHGIALQV